MEGGKCEVEGWMWKVENVKGYSVFQIVPQWQGRINCMIYCSRAIIDMV